MSLERVIMERAPFMLVTIDDSIKISNNEPRKVQGCHLGWHKPKNTLRVKPLRVINHRNKPNREKEGEIIR